MQLEDYENENQNSHDGNWYTYVITASTVAVILFAILAVVLVANKDKIRKYNNPNSPKAAETSEGNSAVAQLGDLISDSNLVSDDLDIWEEFPAEDDSLITNQTVNPNSARNYKGYKELEEEADDEPEEEDLSEGGTKTRIVHANGTEEWQFINQYLDQNEYDNTCFVLKDGRLSYYEDGEKISFTGIDLSKYDGYVDFNEVVRDGIDFCMLRLGSRTYGTGEIYLDEYYYDNLKGATDAGLDVGLIFMSQAVTKEEAIEEATFVLDNIGDFDIKYPICYCMEPVVNDTARIDGLTRDEKTQIARAFMDTIIANGYNTVLYGDKEWLLSKLNYNLISHYDTWLNQPGDIPDFPYDFKMWKYKSGVVNGVAGKPDITISFIDYSLK